MRILGTGMDLVELDRIRQARARFGERFLHRCFTPGELAFCFQQADPTPRLAARFAAKEAGAKALGTGIARGIGWCDIEVVRHPGERPTIQLHGRASEHARRLGVSGLHLSMTHGRQVAGAQVILEGSAPSDRQSAP
jgi:holo-[acyl-carrier protein] synthase